MTIRWVLGPAFASTVTRVAPAPAAPADAAVAPLLGAPALPPKADPVVSLLGVDAAAWTARLGLPAYDPTTHNTLAEVRVYLVPSGHGRPLDGPGYEASSIPFATTGDVSSVVGGGEAAVDLPDVPSGDYFGQTVVGYVA